MVTLPGPFGTPIRLRTAGRTLGRTLGRAALPAAGVLAALGIALAGAGLAARGTGELRPPAAGAITVLRTVVLAALAVHIGELAGGRLAGAGPRPRGYAAPAALLGALASAGQLLVFSALSGLGLGAVYGLREGLLLLVTANALALAAVCAVLRRPGWAAVPLGAAVLAEALRAHPEQNTPAVGVALTVVHLTAASLWLGALLYVLRTARLRGGREVIVRYARLAGWLVAALAVTGTCSTLRRLPLDALLATAYGRLLAVKLLLVAAACALALAARHRLLGGRDPNSPARAELVLLAAVTLLSALLTVVPDPRLGVP